MFIYLKKRKGKAQMVERHSRGSNIKLTKSDFEIKCHVLICMHDFTCTIHTCISIRVRVFRVLLPDVHTYENDILSPLTILYMVYTTQQARLAYLPLFSLGPNTGKECTNTHNNHE